MKCSKCKFYYSMHCQNPKSEKFTKAVVGTNACPLFEPAEEKKDKEKENENHV